MAEPTFGAQLNYKTLLCTNIPELFLDKFVARKHFSRFGNLVNFVLRPRRMTCTVSYATEAEAERALNEGNVFNGHEFDMSYAEIETTPAQKTEEWVDPDVQAEVNAISVFAWGGDSTFKPSSYAGALKSSAAPIGGTKPTGPEVFTDSTAEQRKKDKERTRERPREPPVNKAASQELELLMRKPALNSEEKYRVLDARDKLMRLKQPRSTDARRLEGYCPDMCPEKERVLREFQRQVAIYELEPGSDQQICHETALKQYSRSSADQETPLPHELRHEGAMHMTMSYLMHEIMDISEQSNSNIGDWFHFVWDRTRSIRKEITQQELCSLGAVKLVEQCARFHIHCAARLVAEDPSVFDTKINAENLTKCLQTLKYMYHDLRLKGVQCPREAEFRGYIVLLNLADANFLWDIGQLPVELQSCPPVRRGIQFHLALQDTNFVRFFQLLREPETTYLEACILVSYFTRLRILGLQRLLSAYRAPRKHEHSSLPVDYIQQMLMFTEQDEADEFLESCDLIINEYGRVSYTSGRIHPSEHYRLRRQIDLVESKRQQSVGECICGEALPPKSLYQDHRPHNSFNSQGYLKSSAWTAKDQLTNGTDDMDELPVVNETVAIPKAAPIKDNIFKVPVLSAPISPKLKATPPPQSQSQLQPQPPPAPASSAINGFSFVQAAAATSGGNIFGLKPSTIQQPSFHSMPMAAGAALADQQRLQQKTAEEAKLAALQQAIAAAKQRELELLELKRAKEAQMELARRQQQEQLQRKQQEQLRRQREQEELKRQAALAAAAAEEQQRLRQERREAKLDAQSQEMFNMLLEQFLGEICNYELDMHRLSVKHYESMLRDHIRDLVEQQIRIASYELGLMRRYWRRWRCYRRCQQQKDELFTCLPLSFGGESTSQLVSLQTITQPLALMRRYRQGEACNYRALLAGMEEECWLKLDLWQLLARAMPQMALGARRYYKLLVSLPDHNAGHIMEHALDHGLLQQPLNQEHQSRQGAGYINGLAHGVALCVHKLKGMPNPSNPSELLHADGIVCYVDAQNLQEALRRLQQLCRHSGCQHVALIVVQRQQATESLLELEQHLAKQLQLDTVRHYRIFRGSSLKQGKHRRQLVALLQCAVEFLGKLPHPSRTQLEQCELREWLITHLGDGLFQRLQYAMVQDVAIGRRCRQTPQFCVELYNEAVRRLQLVASEPLEQHLQFPHELQQYVEPLAVNASLPNRLEYFVDGWQSARNRNGIVQLLELAKLPAMMVEEEPCESLWRNYARQSQEDLLVDSIALRSTQVWQLQLQRERMNYLEIVEIFAKERLHFVLRRHSASLPAAIVYSRSTFHKYFKPHWYYEWQPGEPCGEEEAQVSDDERDVEMAVPSAKDLQLDFDEVLGRAQAALKKCEHQRLEREELWETSDSLTDLDRTMQNFERKALAAMQDEHLKQQQQQKQQQQLQQRHQQQQQQQQQQVENLPVSKRQRLHTPIDDEFSALLDRTERLLNESQSMEQRRFQVLQRAKKFL